MLYQQDVAIADSALMVIDAQNSFKADVARWERRDNRQFEANLAALIELYRGTGLPIMFFLDMSGGAVGAFSPDSPFFRLMDFITPRPDEPVLVKHTRNIFSSTNLAERLLEKGVRRLVMTGIQTEQCCETSTRWAADLGYAVDFVTECTMTFPITNPETGAELGVEAIRERTEYAIRGRFAKLRTVAALADELATLKGLQPSLTAAAR